MPKKLLCAFLIFCAAAVAQASDLIQVTGTLLPAAGAARLWQRPEGAEGKPVAWLLVHADHPGTHTYPVAQDRIPNSFPTKITPRFQGENAPFLIGEFKGATPALSHEFGDAVLEEWHDAFDAVAPVWLRAGTRLASDPVDAVLGYAPEAEIDALCCDENTCTPVHETVLFLPERNTETLDALLAAAAELYPAVPDSETPAAGTLVSGGLGRNLLYAFFGGMILNIMPCVLPVIGLKIVSFFEQAGKRRRRAFFLNLCYAAGILSVFTVLALMSVGLSYLFTYGAFQIVMGCVVFAMALNLMGVWEITLPAFLGGRRSGELMGKEGGLGGWFKGVITTLLAIPCGAPLLSPALVWTDSLIKSGSVISVLLIYWVIGLGMAAPFLVIGAFPELLRFLPKPGAWMETFKKVMGFVLLPAVIWILFSMPLGLIMPMTALLASLWFACWLLGRDQYNPDRKRLSAWLFALAVVAVTVLFSFRLPFLRGETYPLPTLQGGFEEKLVRWATRAARSGELVRGDWRLFDRNEFDAELLRGNTVAVDFTADWCMNCKVLEGTVLRAPEIVSLFRGKGIVTMTADWTSRDQTDESREIGTLLNRYGGQQVPVLMIFTPENPDEPVILRGLFTKETLIKEINSLEK